MGTTAEGPPEAGAGLALTLLEERVEQLVGRIVERVQEFYADAGVPVEDMAANAAVLTGVAIGALREGRPPNEDELARAAVLGERRARQGVSLENVLRGLRVGAHEALTMLRDEALAAGLGARDTIALTMALWDWVDEVSVVVAESHRRVEVARARSDQQQRADLVHGLVRGTLDPRRAAERAGTTGLDVDVDHVVVRVRPVPEHPAEEIERILAPSLWSKGVVAVVDGDVVALLPAAPTAALPVPGGVGPSVPLGRLPHSFRHAGRALDAALAFALPGFHRLEDLAFPAIAVGEDYLGELLVARYVTPVRALGDFGDELLHSLRAYARHHQNVHAAATELHVHPNTLRHRLSRYEETTGASLHNVEHLAEIWWALTADRLHVDAR